VCTWKKIIQPASVNRRHFAVHPGARQANCDAANKASSYCGWPILLDSGRVGTLDCAETSCRHSSNAQRVRLTPSIRLSHSISPLDLPARFSDRHFGRSENTLIHQKTKDKRDFRSTVFWLGGKLVPAAQIANRSLAPAISHENRAQKRRANSKVQFSIFQSLQVQGVSPQEPCLRS
jgi:hypothetical protein